ncbi:MAG: choice-of-anchor J domain-containing protein [Bacteroidales bacterium]
MKKFITLLFVCAFLQINAQVVLQESFDDTPLPSGTGQDTPQGWTATTKISGTPMWRIKTSFLDGSTVIKPVDRSYLIGFESKNAPSRAFEEWLTSKEITLLNNERANTVSFYSYHVADGSHTLRISDTSSPNNWEILWTDTDAAYPYPDKCTDSSRLEVLIPNSYKGKTVRLAWVFESPTITSAWGIDHITVEAVIAGVDIRFVDFITPLAHKDTINSYSINKNIPLKVKIQNNGRSNAENVPISYILNNGTTVNDTVPLVKPKEIIEFTFAQAINVPNQAINTLKVNTSATGDELNDNNNSEIIEFWTLDDSTFLVYDFDDPYLADSALWSNSDYVLYNVDIQQPIESMNYENIFKSFPWAVGVGGAGLYHAIWGNYTAFSYSRYKNDVKTPTDKWMVLPKCRISNSSAPVFLQWNAVSCYQKDPTAFPLESYEVLISDKTSTMTDFTKVHGVESEKCFNPNESYIPYNRSVDISAYKGKDVFIAFRLTTSGTGSRGMFALDNIKVFGDATIITNNINETYDEKTVKVFPNPANDFVSVSSENNINKIEVFNLLGERIYVSEPQQTNFNIYTSDYTNGLYLIKIKTDKGETLKKINIIK